MIFLTSITFGQPDTGTSGTVGKSPQAEEFDKKAMERLKRMTPEEVEALDKKLAQALTLFYDREYTRALPIFREISDKVETVDVIFWYASCAARAVEDMPQVSQMPPGPSPAVILVSVQALEHGPLHHQGGLPPSVQLTDLFMAQAVSILEGHGGCIITLLRVQQVFSRGRSS